MNCYMHPECSELATVMIATYWSDGDGPEHRYPEDRPACAYHAALLYPGSGAWGQFGWRRVHYAPTETEMVVS